MKSLKKVFIYNKEVKTLIFLKKNKYNKGKYSYLKRPNILILKIINKYIESIKF